MDLENTGCAKKPKSESSKRVIPDDISYNGVMIRVKSSGNQSIVH